MELRKFLSVFTDQKELFVSLLVFPLLFATIYELNKPITYKSTLTLTIIRSSPDTNTDNVSSNDEYDSFYRLSADEKFTQTIKQWLISPSIVNEILTLSNVDTARLQASDLKKEFFVTQGSPQVLNVQYDSRNTEIASAKAAAVSQVLNNLTDQLNTTVKTQNWFTVQAQKPFTRIATTNYGLIASTSLVVGLCLGILGTLLRYYYTKQD